MNTSRTSGLNRRMPSGWKLSADAGAQTGQRRFERVARERVGVLAGRRGGCSSCITAAPIDRGAQDAEHRVRVDAFRQLAGVDRLLDQAGEPCPSSS